MHVIISEKREELITACQRFHVARLDIFGSAARGNDFDLELSDADFLVDFGFKTGADPYLDLKDAFESILGRKVDLIDHHAIETSPNYLLRRSILTNIESVYAA